MWLLRNVARENAALIEKCNQPKPPSDYQVLKDMLAANPQFRSKYELNDYVLRSSTKKGNPISLDEKNNVIQPHFQKTIYDMYFLEEIFHASMNNKLFKSFGPDIKDNDVVGPGFLDNLERGLKKIGKLNNE